MRSFPELLAKALAERRQLGSHLGKELRNKTPGFGDRRKAMLEDIATLTGGKALTEDLKRCVTSNRLVAATGFAALGQRLCVTLQGTTFRS